MKKITWLDINSSYSHSSAALPIIEAQQVNHTFDFEWSVVNATLKSDIRELVADVVEQMPQIIAYTSWLFTCDMIHQVLARVKAIMPDVIVIGGGPEYLGDNREFLSSHKYIDYVVRGEGEESFYSLIKYISSDKKDICSVDGVCYMTQNGEYVDNSIAKVMKFSELELPENSQFFDWDKPFVQLETTRGCFNSCAFCVSGNDKPLRSQSVDQIRSRIETISQRGIKDVRVLDRTFNSNPRRAIDMLRLFGEYSHMNFHLELHPALLTNEIREEIQILPDGVLHIEAGIQSLDDKVLSACGRHGEKDRALDGLRYLCALSNIETHADLIAGLPFYTLEQIYKDVRTLSEIDAGEIQLESLKLLPGTAMRRDAETLGIFYSPLSPYEVLVTKDISMMELAEAMVLSRVLDFYYNNSAWNSLFRRLICEQEEFLKKITAFFIDKKCYNQPLSQEKQGLILAQFLNQNYHTYSSALSIEWIKNGLSLRKIPNQEIHSSPIVVDSRVEVFFGEYSEGMRVYHFTEGGTVFVFGFDRGKEHSKPLFFGVIK